MASEKTGRMRDGVDIAVETMTDCLVRRSDGRRCDTEFRPVQETITSARASGLRVDGWNFDWSQPHARDFEVCELLLEGKEVAQGMLALRHCRDQLFTRIELVESAPWNVGHEGLCEGVGGHLFAIACKLSWDVRNEGYVQFTAKTALIDHYEETLGARVIGGRLMVIDSVASLRLVQTYFGRES